MSAYTIVFQLNVMCLPEVGHYQAPTMGIQTGGRLAESHYVVGLSVNHLPASSQCVKVIVCQGNRMPR